LKTFASNFADR